MNTNLKNIELIAPKRGGKCITKQYINSKTKIKMRCKFGHVWETLPLNIKKGHWCPSCAGNKRLDIEAMNDLAEERGGKCLSKRYINTDTKLIWKCGDGHIWKATPEKIRAGRWCPICASGISERICRAYFELIFKKNFLKARPKWLVNSRDNQMELDGYCADLNLAFEYQGPHHYEAVGYLKRGNLQQRKEDDNEKRKLCKKHGVILIEVPFSIGYERIYDYIIENCRSKNIKIPGHKTVHFTELNIYGPAKIEIMRLLANGKGGKCLSKQYIDTKTKLKWQCGGGHIWEQKPTHIKGGHWCPFCAKVAKLDLETMKAIALKNGGKCLSKTYKNTQTKLKWRCKKGHIWWAKPIGVKLGHWCPECAGVKKLNLKKMQSLAEKMDGKCLSKKYYNAKTKIKWQCKNGHIWKASPSNINNSGSWCPVCAGVAKDNIMVMKKLALKMNGKCLSKTYKNVQTKLKWRCREGHIWEAKPSHIKDGHWCPFCAKVAKLNIEEMRLLAQKRDGKCLSKKYINNRTKLKWKCKQDHTWWAKPVNIKMGHWCPKCGIRDGALKRSLTIQEMQNLAKNKEGKCLSTTYINNNTKLKWQCKEGHIWEAKPSHIKDGHWCPFCARHIQNAK